MQRDDLGVRTAESRWSPFVPTDAASVWTDDFSNILSVLGVGCALACDPEKIPKLRFDLGADLRDVPLDGCPGLVPYVRQFSLRSLSSILYLRISPEMHRRRAKLFCERLDVAIRRRAWQIRVKLTGDSALGSEDRDATSDPPYTPVARCAADQRKATKPITGSAGRGNVSPVDGVTSHSSPRSRRGFESPLTTCGDRERAGQGGATRSSATANGFCGQRHIPSPVLAAA
jgi:hypothetical protein